jgi:competence protein ComEC
MHLSCYRRPIFLLLLTWAAAIAVFRGYFLKPPEAPPFALPRSGVLVEGRVGEYPAQTRGGWRFGLDGVSLYGRPYGGGLMVYTRSLEGASYGDTVTFLAELESPRGAEVPGGLDWADYLARRGVAAQARATDLEVTRRANPVLRLARAIRYGCMGVFGRALPPEQAAVLGGVVLGEKRGIGPDLRAAFQDSGAMHLLVASGSNVGFVVAVVYFLCARMGVRRRASGLAALGAAGLYVLSVGLEPPLVRAYLMFAAGLAAWLARREAGAFHALTLAALLILALAPRSLFDAGFQMSFLAAYGLTAGFSAWSPYLRVRGLAGKALGLLAVSFFAQLFLYPVLVVYFHKVSMASLVSNMVLVPASAVAMGLGFLLAAFSWAGPAAAWLGWVVARFMAGFIWAVKFFARLPYASVAVPEPSAWAVAGAFMLAFAVLHAPLLGFGRVRLYALVVAGLAVMGLGPSASALRVRGQGGALFGDGNTGSALVSGAGGGLYLLNPGVNGAKLAGAVLESGALELEGVMISSLEKKNYSGLTELSSRIKIKTMLLPYGPIPEDLSLVLAGLRKNGGAVRRLWPGEKAGAEEVSCGWGGYAPGYSGSGDVFNWKVGGITLSRGGVRAELAGAGADAVKGAVVPIGSGLP